MAPKKKSSTTNTTPKDFFMNLLAIVTLYISAFAFGTLLFQIINFNFPDELFYFSAQGFLNAVRSSIASLIVAVPTFILSSRALTKDYQKNKAKKDLRIRHWLIYFTLFAAAVAILISLVTVVYNFLGGELSIRFGLKVLTVLFIAGMIFGYYLYKARAEKEEQQVLNAYMIVTLVAVSLAIIGGFLYIGSPSTQRAREFDLDRINDIAGISSEVQFYYSQNDTLPRSLDDLDQSYIDLKDPQTNENYEYNRIDGDTFEICATFNLDRFQPKNYTAENTQYIGNRHFTAGYNCFEQDVTVDTEQKRIPRPIFE